MEGDKELRLLDECALKSWRARFSPCFFCQRESGGIVSLKDSSVLEHPSAERGPSSAVTKSSVGW